MKPKKLAKTHLKKIHKPKPVKKSQSIIQKSEKKIRLNNSLEAELLHRSILVLCTFLIVFSHYFTKNRMIIIMLSIIALIGGIYAFVQLTKNRGQSLKHTLGILSLAFVIVIGIILVVAVVFFVIVL